MQGWFRLDGVFMPDESADSLRARAAGYREMARTATNEEAVKSLLRLAERFEASATGLENDPAAAFPVSQ
jgi:hypothetical protein